jgi:hypothetical protein
MNEIIFRYPGQKFVGLASKQADGTLAHVGYTLLDVLPKKGDTLFEREVLEVVTDEDVLKERSMCARNEIEVIAVLAKRF